MLETLCSVQKYIFCSMKPNILLQIDSSGIFKLQHLFCGGLYINENAKTCCFNKREHSLQIYPPLSHFTMTTWL
jgi:hypothetical protein